MRTVNEAVVAGPCTRDRVAAVGVVPLAAIRAVGKARHIGASRAQVRPIGSRDDNDARAELARLIESTVVTSGEGFHVSVHFSTFRSKEGETDIRDAREGGSGGVCVSVHVLIVASMTDNRTPKRRFRHPIGVVPMAA